MLATAHTQKSNAVLPDFHSARHEYEEGNSIEREIPRDKRNTDIVITINKVSLFSNVLA